MPLRASPGRVVSLVPSLTEAIATTAPGALVGATDWCTHPSGLEVTRVRGTKNPDLARIRDLRPDLVVANQEENRRVDVERLRAAGVPVWVTRIDSVTEALTSMNRLFTEAFSAPTPAWLTRAEKIWSAPPTGPRLRVVVPIWRDPWLVFGADTYGDDVISRLGWTNLGARIGTRYPHTTLDEILVQQPDVVLLPDEPYPFSATDGPEALEPLHCVPFPGRALSWYGPAMLEARGVLENLAPGRQSGAEARDEFLDP